MDRTERQQLLRKMLSQVAPSETLEATRSDLESLELPGQARGAAVRGVEGLLSNESIDPDQQMALEAIVMPKYRPVVNIVGDTFSTPPHPWEHLGTSENKQTIEKVIPSIGRVELPNSPSIPYAGTGFVVGPNVMMTNRHVAEIFSEGLGQRQLLFKPGKTPAIDFKREVVATPPQLLTVERVLMIHPYWDMALLEVRGLSSPHTVLPLSVVPPEELEEQDVVVIGYPARDWRNDLDLQNRIFGGIYDVKRMQPGKIRVRRMLESFEHEVNTVTHDASTLGGNSGSAVVDIETGEVVGLHFAGLYLDANFAVPTYELARDSRVVDAGVSFVGAVPSTSEWAAAWKLTEGAGDEIAPPTTGPQLQSAGEGLTWTIPLQVSVTLGTPVVSPAAATPTTAAAKAEGLFAPIDPDVVVKAYAEFSLESLARSEFSWDGAISTADCSHLAYERESVVERTARETWSLDTCEFLETDDTECFVASSPDAIVVSFRGTASTRDWLSDLRIISKRVSYGTVHRGFYFAFQAVKCSLEEYVSDIGTSSRELILTGHSLGGALATIAAAEWQGRFPVAGVYTYGQPCVGKRDFRKFMRRHYSSNFYRVVNDDDIVPRVPPTYVHVGRLYHFGRRNRLKSSGVEAADVSSETDTMSEAQFAELQASLRAVAASASTESIGQEGLLPSVSDHSMQRYLCKILHQL